jgi:hypothetical protein
VKKIVDKVGFAVPWWNCPCGCELKLNSTDVANEQRLIRILGPTPRRADLRLEAGSRTKAGPVEPTTKGECRNCNAPMELFTYLAESLELHGAKWPFCDTCMQAAKHWRAA